jgi:hypothetical protein
VKKERKVATVRFEGDVEGKKERKKEREQERKKGLEDVSTVVASRSHEVWRSTQDIFEEVVMEA